MYDGLYNRNHNIPFTQPNEPPQKRQGKPSMKRSNTNFCAVIRAPFGAIGLCTQQEKITEVVYLPADHTPQAARTPFAQQAVEQIEHYFSNPNYQFTLPLQIVGTPFQIKAWQAIATIAPGQLLTYGQLAYQLHTGPRAIGRACATNPIPLIIPCHRIIAAKGLGGFDGTSREGYTLEVKRWLLTHEKAKI